MNEEPSVLATDSERSTVLARARCCRDWPASIVGPWED